MTNVLTRERACGPALRTGRANVPDGQSALRASPETFRVHFSDGTKLDVQAASPADAGSAAKRQHDGVISKIKQVKEQA